MRVMCGPVMLFALFPTVFGGDVNEWIAKVVEGTQGLPGANVLEGQLMDLAAKLPMLRDPVLKAVWPHVLSIAVLSLKQSSTMAQFMEVDLMDDFVERPSSPGLQLRKTVALWNLAEHDLQQESNALTSAYAATMLIAKREMGPEKLADRYSSLDGFVDALSDLLRTRQGFPQTFYDHRFAQGLNLIRPAKDSEGDVDMSLLEKVHSKIAHKTWLLGHRILDCVSEGLLPQAVLTFFLMLPGGKHV